jgi:hypothetical protein
MLAFVASLPINSSIRPAPQPVCIPEYFFENDLEPV